MSTCAPGAGSSFKRASARRPKNCHTSHRRLGEAQNSFALVSASVAHAPGVLREAFSHTLDETTSDAPWISGSISVCGRPVDLLVNTRIQRSPEVSSARARLGVRRAVIYFFATSVDRDFRQRRLPISLCERVWSKAMKHLVHGAAFIAALSVSASAWAQGQTNPPARTAPVIQLPAPSQAPAATPAPAAPETATPETATTAPSAPRPKRHARQAKRHERHYPSYSEHYYREGNYGRAGSPDDSMSDELNARQLQGGWYGGGAPYPYGRAGSPADSMSDELNARQLQGGWYGGGAPYPYGRAGSPADSMSDELNARQLQGGWYGGGAQYPYAAPVPYAPYAPYPALPPAYPRGY